MRNYGKLSSGFYGFARAGKNKYSFQLYDYGGAAHADMIGCGDYRSYCLLDSCQVSSSQVGLNCPMPAPLASAWHMCAGRPSEATRGKLLEDATAMVLRSWLIATCSDNWNGAGRGLGGCGHAYR